MHRDTPGYVITITNYLATTASHFTQINKGYPLDKDGGRARGLHTARTRWGAAALRTAVARSLALSWRKCETQTKKTLWRRYAFRRPIPFGGAPFVQTQPTQHCITHLIFARYATRTHTHLSCICANIRAQVSCMLHIAYWYASCAENARPGRIACVFEFTNEFTLCVRDNRAHARCVCVQSATHIRRSRRQERKGTRPIASSNGEHSSYHPENRLATALRVREPRLPLSLRSLVAK